MLEIEKHIEGLHTGTQLKKKVLKIVRLRWEKMHSKLHSAAFMLEPQFQNARFPREVSLWS